MEAFGILDLLQTVLCFKVNCGCRLMSARSSVKSRTTPFGYTCRRCSRCCQNKHVQLGPYEVARLARARSESTSQFHTAWTVDGAGTSLRQKEDGTCVFLGPQGCEVHADRPLVCRLCPLGRQVLSDGSEHYLQLEGHPLSEGEFHEQGTVDDYLESQVAKPFMAATDGYFNGLVRHTNNWILRLPRVLQRWDKASMTSICSIWTA